MECYFPGEYDGGHQRSFQLDHDQMGLGFICSPFFLLVCGCFVLMGNQYGSMKLGLQDDKPEFSNFSWFAMLFGFGHRRRYCLLGASGTGLPLYESASLFWRRGADSPGGCKRHDLFLFSLGVERLVNLRPC